MTESVYSEHKNGIVSLPMNDNRSWPGSGEDGRALADAYKRLDTARNDLIRLRTEVDSFIRQTVEMMISSGPQRPDGFNLTLPPAELADGRVNNEIRRLCGSIAENLRASLDYGIMELTRRTKSELTSRERRAVSFVIARDRKGFDGRARFALQYVDDSVKDWIERLQPYHGNQTLAFIGGASSSSKHHNLPHVKLLPALNIVLREEFERSNWEEAGWWVFPAGRGHVYTARVDQRRLIIRGKYDAFAVFPICIDQVQIIINTLEYYLQKGHLPLSEILNTP